MTSPEPQPAPQLSPLRLAGRVAGRAMAVGLIAGVGLFAARTYAEVLRGPPSRTGAEEPDLPSVPALPVDVEDSGGSLEALPGLPLGPRVTECSDAEVLARLLAAPAPGPSGDLDESSFGSLRTIGQKRTTAAGTVYVTDGPSNKIALWTEGHGAAERWRAARMACRVETGWVVVEVRPGEAGAGEKPAPLLPLPPGGTVVSRRAGPDGRTAAELIATPDSPEAAVAFWCGRGWDVTGGAAEGWVCRRPGAAVGVKRVGELGGLLALTPVDRSHESKR